MRIVSLNGLRARLKEILGSSSLLFQRFDVALRDQDEAAMQAAMDALRLYPEKTRKDVEEVLLRWLFDPEQADGLLDVSTAGRQLH